MRGRGIMANYESILADIKARDKRDSERNDAPLKAAEDAVLLDNGNLTIGAAVQAAIAAVEARLQRS
jgi:cytidylate kinase